jgi:hypothetical protein
LEIFKEFFMGSTRPAYRPDLAHPFYSHDLEEAGAGAQVQKTKRSSRRGEGAFTFVSAVFLATLNEVLVGGFMDDDRDVVVVGAGL